MSLCTSVNSNTSSCKNSQLKISAQFGFYLRLTSNGAMSFHSSGIIDSDEVESRLYAGAKRLHYCWSLGHKVPPNLVHLAEVVVFDSKNTLTSLARHPREGISQLPNMLSTTPCSRGMIYTHVPGLMPPTCQPYATYLCREVEKTLHVGFKSEESTSTVPWQRYENQETEVERPPGHRVFNIFETQLWRMECL